MTCVFVVGAKGGVGTSIVATNLARASAASGSTVLLDGVPLGSCDLLTGIQARHSWLSLFPVMGELHRRHLDAVTQVHRSGLRIVASPCDPRTKLPAHLPERLTKLVTNLIVDMSINGLLDGMSERTQIHPIAIVTTADPPALRACKHIVKSIRDTGATRIGLVLNQYLSSSPAKAHDLAHALEVPLLAVIPFAPDIVFEQVHFGSLGAAVRNRRWARGFGVLWNEINGTRDSGVTLSNDE
jgi:Flp pilus assembly CpaE family ATPase